MEFNFRLILSITASICESSTATESVFPLSVVVVDADNTVHVVVNLAANATVRSIISLTLSCSADLVEVAMVTEIDAGASPSVSLLKSSSGLNVGSSIDTRVPLLEDPPVAPSSLVSSSSSSSSKSDSKLVRALFAELP